MTMKIHGRHDGLLTHTPESSACSAARFDMLLRGDKSGLADSLQQDQPQGPATHDLDAGPGHSQSAMNEHIGGNPFANIPSVSIQGNATGSASGLMALDGSSPVGERTAEQVSQTSLQYCKALEKELGLNRFQAMGIVANLRHEENNLGLSTGQPVAQGAAGIEHRASEATDGIAKWGQGQASKLADYANRHGIDPGSDRAKIGFVVEQLRGVHKNVLDGLRNEATMEGAASLFRKQFENPSYLQMHGIWRTAYDLLRSYT